MRSVEIFMIIAGTVMVGHSVIGEIRRTDITGGLGMISLGMAMTMEESLIGKIVIISGIMVYMIGKVEGDTGIMMMMGMVGLIMMGSAQTLLMIYIGVEIVGLSFYIMAGRERKGEEGTEAGIKYFVLGALSSGILLMGITIVYAQIGTTEIEMIERASRELIIIGLLFKVGAAPFHM